MMKEVGGKLRRERFCRVLENILDSGADMEVMGKDGVGILTDESWRIERSESMNHMLRRNGRIIKREVGKGTSGPKDGIVATKTGDTEVANGRIRKSSGEEMISEKEKTWVPGMTAIIGKTNGGREGKQDLMKVGVVGTPEGARVKAGILLIVRVKILKMASIAMMKSRAEISCVIPSV